LLPGTTEDHLQIPSPSLPDASADAIPRPAGYAWFIIYAKDPDLKLGVFGTMENPHYPTYDLKTAGDPFTKAFASQLGLSLS
jgi:hypothetical protein